MAKKKAKPKPAAATPGVAQGGVVKQRQGGKPKKGQQKQRQQQPKGSPAGAPAAGAGGEAAAAAAPPAGVQAAAPAKPSPTKKQRKAQARRERAAGKQLTVVVAVGRRKQQSRVVQAGKAQQQPAAAKGKQPAAAKQAGKAKQQPAKPKQAGKGKQPAAAARASQQPSAAVKAAKRKREELEEGTHFYCLDTNVLLASAQLGVRTAWQAIEAGADGSVQLLVPLKVLQELKCIAGDHRHKLRFPAQGGLALLNEAMPCHTRCRVQREDEVFRRHPLALGMQRGDDAVLDCLQYFAALGAQVTLVTLDKAFGQRAIELGLSCLQPQQLLASVQGALGGTPAAPALADGRTGSDHASSSSSSDSDGDTTSSGSRDRGSATESCTEDEAAIGCSGRWVRRRPSAAAAGVPWPAVPLDRHLQPQLPSDAQLDQQPAAAAAAAAEAEAVGAPQGSSQSTAARLAQQLLLAAANLLGSALGASPATGSAEGPACGAAAAADGMPIADCMLQATQGMVAAADCLAAVPDPQLPRPLCDGQEASTVVQLQATQGMANALEPHLLPRPQCDGLEPSTAAQLQATQGLAAAPEPQLQAPSRAAAFGPSTVVQLPAQQGTWGAAPALQSQHPLAAGW